MRCRNQLKKKINDLYHFPIGKKEFNDKSYEKYWKQSDARISSYENIILLGDYNVETS